MPDFYDATTYSTKFFINGKFMRDTLAEFLKEENLTGLQAAMRMGVSKSFFNALMNGRRMNIGADRLAKIAACTGRRIEEFITRVN
jgi:transcriptional regulator with XRE-family HTH domain